MEPIPTIGVPIGAANLHQMINWLIDQVNNQFANLATAGDPPVNTDVPYVTQTGDALNCTMGIWTGEPTSYAYQWQLDGAETGSNAPDYTIAPDDVGKTATCVVTATNLGGSTAAPRSNGLVVA
jgi:hypothetical protein